MEVDQNMLAPLWEDIGSIERSAASLDAEIKELRRFVETTPHLVETERALILEVFEREIDSALADVNRQRVATIAALSSERKFILAELDSLRSVVTNDLEQARVDGTTDLELLVERRAHALVDEAEGLVDVVFWRVLFPHSTSCLRSLSLASLSSCAGREALRSLDVQRRI